MIEEIHLYDFDGTLFRSPEPPADYSGTGRWWADPQSLEPPCVPLKPGSEWWNGPVLSAAKKSINDPAVWAILATGRKDNVFRWRVPELLSQVGLDFDEVHLAPAGATFDFKKRLLLKRVIRFSKTLKRVVLYDDRGHHVEGFEAALEDLPLPLEVDSFHIRVPPMPAGCAGRVAARWLDRTGR